MSNAPRLVYFDRSAWADLIRDEDNGGDAVVRLRRAVRSRQVEIAVSDAVVDETFPTLIGSISEGKRHLKLLLELADWKKGVVKLPKDLVRDEANASLRGIRRPPAFRSSYKTRAVVRKLPDMARRNPGRISAQATRIQDQKKDFENGIRRLRDKMRLDRKNAKGKKPTLSEAIQQNAEVVIGSLLKALRFSSLKSDELKTVLTSPAPRMYAGVHVAYVYFQVVRDWAPRRGDGYDLLHAVAATSAEEFVSGDERLRETVASAGGGNPKVWTLSEFIDSL